MYKNLRLKYIKEVYYIENHIEDKTKIYVSIIYKLIQSYTLSYLKA